MRLDAGRLLEQVRANLDALQACPKHEFGAVVGEGRGTMCKYRHRCLKCNGEMADKDIMTYARGFAAAGGNPNEIAKFWDGSPLLTGKRRTKDHD